MTKMNKNKTKPVKVKIQKYAPKFSDVYSPSTYSADSISNQDMDSKLGGVDHPSSTYNAVREEEDVTDTSAFSSDSRAKVPTQFPNNPSVSEIKNLAKRKWKKDKYGGK